MATKYDLSLRHIAQKQAGYLCLIFRQRMQPNVIITMNPVIHLAAADCASGVAKHIDISKHSCTIIYHQQDPDNMDVLEAIFPQTGHYFSSILYHITEDNISFQMNRVSRLAAAVCAFGNNINFTIATHSDTVISHNGYKIWLKSKTHCTKTGWLFVPNISSANAEEYYLLKWT